MSYRYNWGIVLEEPYYSMLVNGVEITLVLAVASAALSFVAGALLCIGRRSSNPALKLGAAAICHLLRGLPGTFWLLLWFMLFPVLLPDDMGSLLNQWDSFPILAAVLGLGFNNTPYIADILYSGVSSVKREVTASARMAGMTTWQLWRIVILPGAILTTLPALNARFVHNLKNTALAMIISVPELTWSTQEIESLTFAGVEVTTVSTLIYSALTLTCSGVFWLIESRLRARYRLPPNA